jgi:hypothetical protein
MAAVTPSLTAAAIWRGEYLPPVQLPQLPP